MGQKGGSGVELFDVLKFGGVRKFPSVVHGIRLMVVVPDEACVITEPAFF